SLASFCPLTAVVIKSWFPHMIGLEWPRPGIGVFHFTFSPAGTFHWVGVAKPSAIPLAFGPRDIGQGMSCARALPGQSDKSAANIRKIAADRRALRFMGGAPTT